MRFCIVATSGISLINFRGKLIEEIVKMGNEVFCLSIEPETEMSEQVSAIGAKYIQISGSRVGTGVFDGIKMIREYKKIFNQIHPDYCFLYMSKPIAFGGYAAIKCKVPHVNILVNGLENAYYRKSVKDFIVRRVMNFFYRYVGKRADNFFVQNSDDFNYFISKRLVKKDKMTIINGSGVDMNHFIKCEMPKEINVAMISRLLWSKGIKEYLSAIKIVKGKLPSVNFMLVGGLDINDEAISKHELEKFINDYEIEYVGHAKDVRPFLNKCTIFVHPSHHEGVPRIILEAMAIGRPIITTNAPGCKETVIDGVNGYLVEIGDVDSLAEKIVFLAENENIRNNMAEKSYNYCLEKFEVSKVNNEMLLKMGLVD